MKALIVTARPVLWRSLSGHLAGQRTAVRVVPLFAEALEQIESEAPDLLILDPEGQDAEAEALRKNLIGVMMVNASILTAVVSDMDAETFHDAMEGLGVLFMLPPQPDRYDICRLGEAFAAVRANES